MRKHLKTLATVFIAMVGLFLAIDGNLDDNPGEIVLGITIAVISWALILRDTYYKR